MEAVAAIFLLKPLEGLYSLSKISLLEVGK